MHFGMDINVGDYIVLKEHDAFRERMYRSFFGKLFDKDAYLVLAITSKRILIEKHGFEPEEILKVIKKDKNPEYFL